MQSSPSSKLMNYIPVLVFFLKKTRNSLDSALGWRPLVPKAVPSYFFGVTDLSEITKTCLCSNRKYKMT